MAECKFITDREIYTRVIQTEIPRAGEFVWLGTSDLKDLHVEKRGRMVPFLEILSDLIERKVAVRLLHAKEPGPAFREDFDRYPALISGMERILCPRVHFKSVIVDGRFAYTGSANLTGAGMGPRPIRVATSNPASLPPTPPLSHKSWSSSIPSGAAPIAARAAEKITVPIISISFQHPSQGGEP